jgi:hypothetical protein
MGPETAQNLNKNPNQIPIDVTIRVWGERLNSPHPERRKLFVEVKAYNTPDWVETDADLFEYALVSADSVLATFVPSFPNSNPWWLYNTCKYCARRFSDSIARGLPTNTWRTAYCLRHGILFNGALFDIDNKQRVISAGNHVFVFASSTGKYEALFTIYRDSARAEISRVDGAVYRFTYHNHTNSYPFSSSYAYLVRRLRQFVSVLRSVVSHCDVRNIFINGARVCPPPSDAPHSGGAGAGGV